MKCWIRIIFWLCMVPAMSVTIPILLILKCTEDPPTHEIVNSNIRRINIVDGVTYIRVTDPEERNTTFKLGTDPNYYMLQPGDGVYIEYYDDDSDYFTPTIFTFELINPPTPVDSPVIEPGDVTYDDPPAPDPTVCEESATNPSPP